MNIMKYHVDDNREGTYYTRGKPQYEETKGFFLT